MSPDQPDPSKAHEDGHRVVEAAMHAMEAYTGVVPGHRRAHARGVGLLGTFEPSGELAALTSAEHLQSTPTPVTVRLSNGAGSPYAPDHVGAGRGTVLGLGVRFALRSGGVATWAAANLPAFPARTPEEFVAVTTASRPAFLGKPGPLRLGRFALTHRHALKGLRAIGAEPTTRSLAHIAFNGLHTYYFVAADGSRRPFRYSWVPDLGPARLSEVEGRQWPPQFLVEEIVQRLDRGPVSWTLDCVLGEPGDPTDDQTAAWPQGRRRVAAGRLVLDRVHPDQDEVDAIVFDPTGVPPGIECSDDPLLSFRSQVYSASSQRRRSETRPIDDLVDPRAPSADST